MAQLLHRELSRAVIGAFFEVYNTLGYGFLEKVYENAMVHELRKCGYCLTLDRKPNSNAK